MLLQPKLLEGKQGGVLKYSQSIPGSHAQTRPSLWRLLDQQSL